MASESPRTFWEKRRGSGKVYVQIMDDCVIHGRDTGNRHHDSAGQVSHAEFLAGRFHDLIRGDFGAAALAEMIAAVERLSRP